MHLIVPRCNEQQCDVPSKIVYTVHSAYPAVEPICSIHTYCNGHWVLYECLHCMLLMCLVISLPVWSSPSLPLYQTTRWVVREVLTPQLPRQRAIMIEKFIRIAESCLEWKNFNTAFEVTLALQSAPVRRLHQTWQEVSQEVTFAQQQHVLHTSACIWKNLRCYISMYVRNRCIQNLCLMSLSHVHTYVCTHMRTQCH